MHSAKTINPSSVSLNGIPFSWRCSKVITSQNRGDRNLANVVSVRYLYTLQNIFPGVTQLDQTLEILMLDLDQEAMNKFYKSSSSNADEVTRVTGISEFLPGALINAALFYPCGYSANGLLDNSYFSIHVTPQEKCSYASFETNVKWLVIRN